MTSFCILLNKHSMRFFNLPVIHFQLMQQNFHILMIHIKNKFNQLDIKL